MKHRLIDNLGLKLISVLCACLIWLLVMDNNDPESKRAYKNIPVTQVNQDTITNANKTYSVLDNTDTVTVYVTARRSVHSRLSTASFTVKADMENYNEDLGSVPLEVTCSNPAVTQESMSVSPSSMKINMEDKVEQSFGIVTSVSGNAANGYELGKTSILTGDTIKIAGPESLIDIIGKVTVPIELGGMTGDQTGFYSIRIQDKNGAQLTDSQMSKLELKDADGVVLKDNSVEVEIEIWKIYEEIALSVETSGEPAEGYQVTEIAFSPKTVNLTGPADVMEELGGTLILTEPLNISGLKETREYTVNLEDTLEQYTDVRLEQDVSPAVTITVKVDEIGTRTLEVPVSELQVENEPENKRLIFTPADKLPVNVRSTGELLDALEAADIQLSIDLTDCQSNGSYTLPVTVTLPEGYELNSDVSIVVNVEDEEQEQEAERLTEES